MNDREFYTVRGYALHSRDDLTPSMEDYLEMAYRLGKDKGYVRIGDIAERLNVQPPAVSRMIQKLAEMGYLRYERYGVIEFTQEGLKAGQYLLNRHETIEKFLAMIGVTNSLLESTEKIEHSLSEETLECFILFVEFLHHNQEIMEKFQLFKTKVREEGKGALFIQPNPEQR